MDPALKSALYNQMMMPQQAQNPSSQMMPAPTQDIPESSYNPISNGSLAAIKASKQSLGMDEQERSDAKRMAIGQFFANMASSRNTNQLGRINESFNPAIKAYLSEQNRVENLNASLMEQEQKRRERQEDLALKREAISARNSKNNFAQDEYNQTLRDEGKIPENAISLSRLPANERRAYSKERTERIKRGQSAANVIKITNEIDGITDKYPDLSTDMVNVLLNSKKGLPGFIDIAKLKIANTPEGKAKRTAIEKFNKLSNDLVVQSLSGVSGRMATDMYKEMLANTKPDPTLTHEAIKYVNQHIRDEYTPFYQDGKDNQKSVKHDYYIPDFIPDIENNIQSREKSPEQMHANSMQYLEEDQKNSQSLANPQDAVQQWRAMHPEASNVPDEFIVRGLQEGRL